VPAAAAAMAVAPIMAAAAPGRPAARVAAAAAPGMAGVPVPTAGPPADPVAPTAVTALAGLESADTAAARPAAGAAAAHGAAPGREGRRGVASGGPDGTTTGILAANPAQTLTGTSVPNAVIVTSVARLDGRRHVHTVAGAVAAPRTGRPARPGARTATGSAGTGVARPRGTAVARATAESALTAVAGSGAIGIRTGNVATSVGPAQTAAAVRRTTMTRSGVAADTAIAGTAATARSGLTEKTALSGVLLDMARTARGEAEGSAMTSPDRDGRLANSGRRAGAASAGTYRTALAALFRRSGRNAGEALTAMGGRGGVMMAGTGAKPSSVAVRSALSGHREKAARPAPGRDGQPTERGLARAGRSGLAARLDPVASLAMAARGQALMARGRIGAGPTVAVPIPRRPGFRTASPTISFPGRRRPNSRGFPRTWPLTSAGTW